MRRWDGLVESYLEVCEARGLSPESRRGIRGELDRLGCWLKRRRPKPNLEEVDGQILIEYLRRRTPFHAKATCGGGGEQAAVLGGVFGGAGGVEAKPDAVGARAAVGSARQAAAADWGGAPEEAVGSGGDAAERATRSNWRWRCCRCCMGPDCGGGSWSGWTWRTGSGRRTCWRSTGARAAASGACRWVKGSGGVWKRTCRCVRTCWSGGERVAEKALLINREGQAAECAIVGAFGASAGPASPGAAW